LLGVCRRKLAGWLKEDAMQFSLRNWWTLMAGLGAAVTLISIPLQSGAAFFMGLGIALIGAGVWVNPEKEALHGLRGLGSVANPFSSFWFASYWSGAKLYVSGLTLILVGFLILFGLFGID
jgi:hypothetical protein